MIERHLSLEISSREAGVVHRSTSFAEESSRFPEKFHLERAPLTAILGP